MKENGAAFSYNELLNIPNKRYELLSALKSELNDIQIRKLSNNKTKES